MLLLQQLNYDAGDEDDCIDEVSSWMRSNRLQINPSKTEVLWCSSSRRQHQIPTSPVRIGSTYVIPVTSVRDLGLYIDCDVSLQTHVTVTVRSCFAALRQIRSVRRCLPRHALLSLIRALRLVSKFTFPCRSAVSVAKVAYVRNQQWRKSDGNFFFWGGRRLCLWSKI